MTAGLNGQELPEGWIWADLSSIVTNHDGRRIPVRKSDRETVQGQYPYYGASGIIDYVNDYLFDGEYLLLAEDGANLLSRSTPIAFRASGKFWVNNHAHILTTKGSIPQSYLEYYFAGLDLSPFVTGTAQPKLTQRNMNYIQVPVAPLNEQRRIVAAIETQFTRLDAAVTALKRSQANLKRYRAAVLKAACEGRLVPTEAALAQAEGRSYEPAAVLLERILTERRHKWEAENPKKKYQEPVASDASGLPEGWCWATVDYFITRITSGSRGWAKYYSDGGALFIRVGNFDRHSIRLNLTSTQFVDAPSGPEAQRTKVCAGDLLVTITADVGMVAVVDSIIHEFGNSYVNQHVALLHPVDSRFMNYVAWAISSEVIQGQIREIAYGMTKQGLNLEDVKNLAIPLPPLAEQHRIVAELERRLSLIDQLEKTIKTDLARANRLRQSILKRAFAGQLVPQDPNDEPASVLLERIQAAKH